MTPPTPKPWEHAKSGGSEGDALAARFVESLSFDTRLYDADLRGSVAHARMLSAVGLLTESELGAIERGLEEIRREIEAAAAGPGGLGSWPGWRIELEDVHMCIEAALIEKAGDAGRRLHTGRSRNDQVALDLRLWLRDACAGMASSLDACLLALEHLAERQGDVVMPGYTHLQRAQPIVLGGELMAWHVMFARDRHDFRRMAQSPASGLAVSPLGSGAVAGSSLPLDRTLAAAELGFGAVSSSAIDATASRDEALDFLYTLSRTAMHLSRLAEQWVIYATTEFGFLTIDGRYTTGSSMMPQKRNPDMLELIRGKCGTVYGHLVALLTICKGLPIGYNRDLQEDKRHVFAAFDTVHDSAEIAARIIATAAFNEERIARTLDQGHLDATSLAEYLVTRGVPFRTAHQIVGTLVRRCEEGARTGGRPCALAEMPLEEFVAVLESQQIDNASAVVESSVYQWLGAKNVTRRYKTAGNAGPGVGGVGGYRDALSAAARSRDKARAGAAEPGAAEPGAGAPGGGPAEADTPTRPPAPDDPAAAAGAAGAAPDDDDGSATTSGVSAMLFEGERPEGDGDDGSDPVITEYARLSRTLDDLPYTEEFEALYEAAVAKGRNVSRQELLHRLQNLRKAGKLPKVGRSGSSPPRISTDEEDLLRDMVLRAVAAQGKIGPDGTVQKGLGYRDNLPFTPAFDRLVQAFNATTGRHLTPHQVWRLIAKLAK